MTPDLKTARLILTIPYIHNTAPYVRWLNDPEVVKFSEQRHLKHNRDSQQEFLLSFDGITSHIWEIQLNDRPIGSITAYLNLPNRRAEMGILIGEKKEWRKGYAAEAWMAVMNWLKEQGIDKIEGGCHPLNLGMMMVFARVGMELEARIHDHFLEDGVLGELRQRAPLFRFGKLL